MNVDEIKIGEIFTKDGVKYEKTRDGIKRLDDDTSVSAPTGEVIIESQLLKG